VAKHPITGATYVGRLVSSDSVRHPLQKARAQWDKSRIQTSWSDLLWWRTNT